MAILPYNPMQLGDPLWITHVNANFAAIESGLKSIGLIDVSALNEAEMLALDVPVGTKCWRPDTGTVWQLTAIPASNILNWVELPDLTLSVNEVSDNRVAGKPQSLALTLSVMDSALGQLSANKADILTASRTLYVDAAAPLGGDGSQSSPFKTIQAAVDSLPLYAGSQGVEALVLIAAGTYAEIVGVKSHNYVVSLVGTGTLPAVIGGLNILGNAMRIRISGNIKIQYMSGLTYTVWSGKNILALIDSANVLFGNGDANASIEISGTGDCVGVNASYSTIAATNSSTFRFNISGCAVGFRIAASTAALATLPAVNPINSIGLRVEAAAHASYYSMNSAFATTLRQKSLGGIVTTGDGQTV